MAYPTTGNLAPSLSDLSGLAKDVRAIQDRARAILADIRPGLIGQRVRRFDRVWEIKQVQIWGGGDVTCYGVRGSKRGQGGTRGFDLGMLEQCESLRANAHAVGKT